MAAGPTYSPVYSLPNGDAPAADPRRELAAARLRLAHAERQLRESYSDWYAGYDNARMRYSPDEWAMIGGYPGAYPADRRQKIGKGPLPFVTEPAWRQHIAVARDILTRSGTGIGFLEHVQAFVGPVTVQFVLPGPAPGPGATGPVDADSDGTPDAAPEVVACMGAWEEWAEVNEWSGCMQPREKESRVRRLREGNVLLRHFRGERGEVPWCRWLEPEWLQTPARLQGSGFCSHGVETDPRDPETVRAYHLAEEEGRYEPEEIPADAITHLKGNVDRIIPVGLSDFFPVGDSLENVGRLLENMQIVAAAQAAVAWWEQFARATGEQVGNTIPADADLERPKFPPGNLGLRTVFQRNIEPGSVIKTEERIVTPGPTTAPEGFLEIIKASLRGAGFRFGLPDSFVTDAGESYAGVLVKGSPFVTRIGDRQEEQCGFVRAVVLKVLKLCEESGRLPRGISRRVKPVVTARDVVMADEEKQARTGMDLIAAGLEDPHEFIKGRGRDPKQVYANLAAHKARMNQMGGPPGAAQQPPVRPAAPGMVSAPPGSAGGDGTSGQDWLLGESVVSEGFTGTVTDKLGRELHYVNGKRVAKSPVQASAERPAADPDAVVARHGGAAWREDLTPDETRAVERFQGGGSYLQKDLRSGNPGPQTLETAKHLDSAIEKAGGLREPVAAYRGLDFDTAKDAAAFLADKPVGAEFADPGYASTSIDPAYIKDFWRGNEDNPAVGARAVRIDLKLPAGTPGVFMSAGGSARLAHEKEFLLARGSKFRVVGREPFGAGGTKLTVEYVPAADAPKG